LAEYGRLPNPLPKWFPTPGNRRKVQAIQDIEDVVMRIVAERRAGGVDRGDLLSTLVFARDANGEPMTDKEVRDEAMTIFFAGHETTAHAMTWAWYLLAKNPRVAEKLFEEVDRVCGDRAPSVADLPSLPYSELVFKEALRLIPAVWAFMRSPNRDLELGGYAFPKGANIFISPYMLGRDARWWKNPERFEPERFENDAERFLPKGAFVPFAAGPRVCLGKNFALMEARLVLCTLIQKLRPELVSGFEPNRVAELSLHAGEQGLQTVVRLRERSSKTRRSSERLSDAPAAE
jgi:cytochrome P450